MNYENIIIIILSIYILYIDKYTILFKDLLDNEITKIIILFFIIFNKNHIISLLLLIAYVLSLNYIYINLNTPNNQDLLYIENNKESIEKDQLELEKFFQFMEELNRDREEYINKKNISEANIKD